MLLGFSLVSLELVVTVFCLLILMAGLVRITTKRQMEVLKDYLQPEKLPIEQLVMRSEKSPDSQNPNSVPPPNHSDSPDATMEQH